MHLHVLVERRAIRQVADLGSHVVRTLDDVEPADLDGPARGQKVTSEHAKRRGLSRAVQAEQTDDLA